MNFVEEPKTEKIMLKDADGKMKYIEVPKQEKKMTNTQQKYDRKKKGGKRSQSQSRDAIDVVVEEIEN